MYIAELRGKLSSRAEWQEDILTSNVFSFFKYSNRQIFLKGFLERIEIRISDNDAENAEFIFWPKYTDGTEPDLVVLVGNYYLLIEAKFLSGFEEDDEGHGQLEREVRGGILEAENLSKEFYLIVVTADYFYQPEYYSYVKHRLPKNRYRWINWQMITSYILEVIEGTNLSGTERLLCQDLYQLLERKNLRSFRDFESIPLHEALDEVPPMIYFASQTAIFRGDFIGFERVLVESKELSSVPHEIFFQGEPLFSNLYGEHGLSEITGDIYFSIRGHHE